MTDKLRQAAEMALEALEEINEISKPPHCIPLPGEIDGAMDLLRQALAEPDTGIDRGAISSKQGHDAFE